MKIPSSIIKTFESIANAHYGISIYKNPLGIITEYCENDNYWGVKYYHEELVDTYDTIEQGEGYLIGECNMKSSYIYLKIAINKLNNKIVILK